MPTKEDCLRGIDDARRAIVGIEAAYVARTRLKRLILACARMIAHRYRLPEPILPERLQMPDDSEEHLRRISDCCNRLLEETRILSQPSEPLDDRWRNHWASVLGDLDLLKNLVVQD